MSPLTETTLLDACRTLFGDELSLNREFLWYLQPSGAKSAYRQRAKEAHPDRYSGVSPHRHRQQTACFQQLNRAYELLCAFFVEREQGNRAVQPPQPSTTAAARAEQRVPERPLEFGHYLFSCGAISYRQLIDALVWQRRQRPSIGELALRFGWLRPEGVARIGRERGPYARFGERAVRLGLLSAGQVQALLRHQRTLHRRIGVYFVEQRILTVTEVETYAQQLDAHNARVTFQRRGR